MLVRPPLVDVTRLFTRLRYSAPTGMDRVNFAYARRFHAPRHDGSAVAITGLGPRLMPRPSFTDLVAALESRWKDDEPGAGDPDLARVRRWLSRPPGNPLPPGADEVAPRSFRRTLLEEARRKADVVRWRPAASAPEGAVYLHTSHIRLDLPHQFAWLARRPDIRPVFMVNDLIPIEFPEYVMPGEDVRHRVRLATVARHAAAVVAISQDVADRLSAHLRRENLRVPPIRVAPLGVESAFTAATGTQPRTSPEGRPYLIVCSTIEARKNHVLLLQIWRQLVAALGDATPALVIVGRRGWESESATDILDRCPTIRPHVMETSGLSTAGLVSLVAGAQALLMPSFAEGYGIPIVEALALGTPVIASDIGVFREVARERATFVHPIDGLGWREAIMRAAGAPAPALRRTEAFDIPTWDRHFAILDEVIAEL